MAPKEQTLHLTGKNVGGLTKTQRELAQRRRARAEADMQKVAAGEIKNAAIAKKYRVSTKTVTIWVKGQRLKDGSEKIIGNPHGGLPLKLNATQFEQLRSIYHLGAKASGFDTDLWSIIRLQEVVQKTFGIGCSERTINRYLVRLDPTYEKRNAPTRQPRETRAAAVTAATL